MIPIKRPKAPAAFKPPNGKAALETAALKATMAANPAADLEFKGSVWKPAKKPYWKAQHSKCIFCEGFVPAQSHGDVEHFRPKNGISDTRGGKITLRTYWWLAYDWDNYWASCQLCNQSFKKNLFPLEPSGVRALTPSDNLANEKPLLLDPNVDDPRDHLIFRREEIFARDGSERGKATIEICGLDRDDLREARRLALVSIQTVLGFYLAYPNLPNLRQECSARLQEFASPVFPYSAMARDLIIDNAPEILQP